MLRETACLKNNPEKESVCSYNTMPDCTNKTSISKDIHTYNNQPATKTVGDDRTEIENKAQGIKCKVQIEVPSCLEQEKVSVPTKVHTFSLNTMGDRQIKFERKVKKEHLT